MINQVKECNSPISDPTLQQRDEQRNLNSFFPPNIMARVPLYFSYFQNYEGKPKSQNKV